MSTESMKFRSGHHPVRPEGMPRFVPAMQPLSYLITQTRGFSTIPYKYMRMREGAGDGHPFLPPSLTYEAERYE